MADSKGNPVMKHYFLADVSDFIFVSDPPEEGNIIFIPGGSYPELPEYDEFRETVTTSKDSAEKWFADMAKTFRSTEEDLTDLASEEKSAAHGKRAKRIYRSFPELSGRTKKSFEELKEKFEEIKDKFGKKTDKSA